jgi:hypothetical protein
VEKGVKFICLCLPLQLGGRYSGFLSLQLTALERQALKLSYPPFWQKLGKRLAHSTVNLTPQFDDLEKNRYWKSLMIGSLTQEGLASLQQNRNMLLKETQKFSNPQFIGINRGKFSLGQIRILECSCRS